MTLFAKLFRFIVDHLDELESEDRMAHLQVIERLRVVLTMEEDAIQDQVYEAQLSDIPCCECGSRVLKHPDYLRLKLCTMCMVHGLFARCAFCGENYPEHHPGGRGCSKWERREDAAPLVDELERL